MGCVNSKKSGASAGGKTQDSIEKNFVPLDKKVVYTNKSDVVARHRDFVVEYKDMAIFQEKYELSDILGQGAFGTVQKATLRSNGELRAVKVLDKLALNAEERIRLQYEIDILKNLNHPNIVRLYEVYQSRSKLLLVTELCDGHELYEEITQRKVFNEKEAAQVCKMIL